MKDERISLITAKILKEKNFTEGVYGLYTEYIKSHKSDNPSFNYKKGEIEISGDYFINNAHCDFSCKHYIMYAAPTQSLVLRWLREVHGIVIGVHLQLYGNDRTDRLEKEKYYSWMVEHNNRDAYNSFNDCDTYEEALEIGILEALNTITL